MNYMYYASLLGLTRGIVRWHKNEKKKHHIMNAVLIKFSRNRINDVLYKRFPKTKPGTLWENVKGVPERLKATLRNATKHGLSCRARK